MNSVIEKNRRFYEHQVKGMIHTQFPDYEDRIAVGIAGEGSDCFCYDDEISIFNLSSYPNIIYYLYNSNK